MNHIEKLQISRVWDGRFWVTHPEFGGLFEYVEDEDEAGLALFIGSELSHELRKLVTVPVKFTSHKAMMLFAAMLCQISEDLMAQRKAARMAAR